MEVHQGALGNNWRSPAFDEIKRKIEESTSNADLDPKIHGTRYDIPRIRRA
jgi:hypothetical protein